MAHEEGDFLNLSANHCTFELKIVAPSTKIAIYIHSIGYTSPDLIIRAST
jgi:hypothetical protein